MSGDGARRALSAEERKSFAWLNAPFLQKVVGALEAHRAGAARFVGGCVRDSLYGEEPKDFDIATLLTPGEVVAALKAAGLKSAPTGIDHGTITAIVEHRGVEVTTLRADVSTDGRRATVAFTEDWSIDANRRDFTINALYLSPEGVLHDPIGGFEDIVARQVRFIGDARQRIREDFLRILRFFRFSARFADCFDEEGLQACADLREGIASLSAERVGAEFMAILALARAPFALHGMEKTKTLGRVWNAPADIDAVERMKQIAPEAEAPVVLAALFGSGGEGVRAELRLSNAEGSVRSNALRAADQITPNLPDKRLRALIYRQGREVFLDGAALACARGGLPVDDFERYRCLGTSWRAPAFPYSGRDLIARGLEPGPDVARLLLAAEARWVEEDFPDMVRTEAILDEILAPG